MSSSPINTKNSSYTVTLQNTATSTDYTWGKGVTATNIQSKLKVNGDAEFDGDIKIQGRSITESLTKIEERLNILIPNVRLEKDWEELGRLRMQYVELERKLLEQQRVFDILKKS